MLEFLWTVVGFGMAVYSTYMLLSQASLAQSETLTEAHVTRAPSPKAKAPAAPKKEPEVQSPEQARLRELKRGYEAAKLARDRHGRDCEESSILNAEEIEKLKGVVSRLQDKHRQVEADRAVQTERIARYGKRHTEIGEKIKAGKHDVSTEDGQLKRLQREVEEAVRAADEARDDLESAQKQKDDLAKKLKNELREASNLQYKRDGMQRRITGIDRENDMLRREIEFRLGRVEERRLRQERYRGNKGGGKGGKGGKRHGGRKGGDAPLEEEGGSNNNGHADEQPPWSADVSGGGDVGGGGDVFHPAPPRAPTPPTSPPPADDGGKVDDLLAKAMANPIGRWIDDLDGPW